MSGRRRRSKLKAYVRLITGGVQLPRRIPLSWPSLAEFLQAQKAGLAACARAEYLAAKQTEELRVARNRIANAADHLRDARRLLGIGAYGDVADEVRRALDCLTFPEQEGA